MPFELNDEPLSKEALEMEDAPMEEAPVDVESVGSSFDDMLFADIVAGIKDGTIQLQEVISALQPEGMADEEVAPPLPEDELI